MPAWLAPVLQGAASLAGGAASGLGAWKSQMAANQANKEIAQAQMDFQERMSNTAWQRGVADMKAAGINPMLAVTKGGASSPAGASARMEAAGARGLEAALSSALGTSQMKQQKYQNKFIQAQTDAIEVNTAKARAMMPIYKKAEEILNKLTSSNPKDRPDAYNLLMKLIDQRTPYPLDAPKGTGGGGY